MMLGQALNLINGPTIAQAIADGNNAISKLVTQQKDDAKVVEEIFLRVLSRQPSQREIEHGIAALRAKDDAHEKLKAQLAEHERQLAEKQREWERGMVAISWTPLEVADIQSAAGAEFARQEDGSIFVDGKLDKDTYGLTADTTVVGITGIRLEALADDRLPNRGPGRAPNGNFVLSELTLAAISKDNPNAESIELHSATADFSQEGWPVANAIDGNPDTGWAVMPSGGSAVGKSHVAVFELKQPIKLDGARLAMKLTQQYPDGKHLLGKFRISVTNAKPPLMPNGPPRNITAIIAIAADQRTPEQQAELARFYRSTDAELARLEAAVAESAKLHVDQRLTGAQDLVWALINSPAFLFNR
jgi:hypothetical protein